MAIGAMSIGNTHRRIAIIGLRQRGLLLRHGLPPLSKPVE
jgi:hypothetical protein